MNIRHGCWILLAAVWLGLAGCHQDGCTRFGDQPCISATDWAECYAGEMGGDVRTQCPDSAPFCNPQGPSAHTCAPYRGDPPAPPPDAGASVPDEGAATCALPARRRTDHRREGVPGGRRRAGGRPAEGPGQPPGQPEQEGQQRQPVPRRVAG
jgi:hypothetical protein